MGSRKITESLAGENLEGLQPRALNRGGGLNSVYCAAWFWMRSKEDLVKMDVL